MAQAQRAIDPLNLNALYLKNRPCPGWAGRGGAAAPCPDPDPVARHHGRTAGHGARCRMERGERGGKGYRAGAAGFTVTAEDTRREDGHAYAIVTATPPMAARR
jgi:hypothetical protein